MNDQKNDGPQRCLTCGRPGGLPDLGTRVARKQATIDYLRGLTRPAHISAKDLHSWIRARFGVSAEIAARTTRDLRQGCEGLVDWSERFRPKGYGRIYWHRANWYRVPQDLRVRYRHDWIRNPWQGGKHD